MSPMDNPGKWLYFPVEDRTSHMPTNSISPEEIRLISFRLLDLYFTTLQNDLKRGRLSLDTNPNQRIMVRALVEYYESPNWKRDYEAEERGEFPTDISRGILSQDGLDHFFSEIFPDGTPKWVYEEESEGFGCGSQGKVKDFSKEERKSL